MFSAAIVAASLWTLPGAISDKDLTNNTAYGTPVPTIVGRATSGFSHDSKGNFTQFPKNTARLTDLGVLTETQGISYIRNSSFVGCFAPNWVGPNLRIALPAGLGYSLDTGTKNGMPGLFLNIFGTSSITATALIIFSNNTDFPITAGHSALTSAYIAQISGGFGDPSNFSIVDFNMAGTERRADGSAIRTVFPTSSFIINSDPLYYDFNYNVTDVTTAYFSPALRFGVQGGSAIALGLFVAFPQCEMDVPFTSSPIVNDPYIPLSNLAPNPGFSGGVPGTTTLPSGYAIQSSVPYTTKFIGIQSVSGKNAMVIEFSATFGASVSTNFFIFENGTNIGAAVGDLFVSQFSLAFLSGDMSGVASMGMTFRELNGGTPVQNDNFPVITALTSELQQKFSQYTVAMGNTNNITTGIFIVPLPNTTQSFRLAFYLPELDKNNPPVPLSPLTRAADVFTGSPLTGTEGALQLEHAPGEWLNNYPIFGLNDGTTNNQAAVMYDSIDHMILRVTKDGTSTDTQVETGRLAGFIPSKTNMTWGDGKIRVSSNGNETIEVSAPWPFTTNPVVFKGPNSGYYRRETYWDYLLNSDTLRGLSSNGFMCLQSLGSAQSNSLGSHAFVSYLLTSTNFYMPAGWVQAPFSVPKSLMFLVEPTPLDLVSGAVRISDMRFGSNRASGAATFTDMSVLDQYLASFTSSKGKQFVTSSGAMTLHDVMVRILADKLGNNAFVLGSTNAVGGASIRSMLKVPTQPLQNGVVPYDANLAATRRGKEISRIQGMRHRVIAWLNNGHQSDGSQPVATTVDDWTLQKQTSTADILNITGQSTAPIYIGNLFGDFANTERNAITGNLLLYLAGIYEMHGSEFAWMTLGQILGGYFGDNNHFAWLGTMYTGQRYARALYSLLTTGSWPITLAVSAVRTANYIEIEFQIPVPPIVFDVTNVTNPSNYNIPGLGGVQVLKQSDSSYLTMTSMVPILPNKIGITFSDTISNDIDLFVDIALYGYTTPFTNMYVQTEQPRCIIRDSDPTLFPNGLPDYGWAGPQRIAVPGKH